MNALPGAAWTVARFGGVRLDRRHRELSRGGVRQPLAPRAFDVLVALIERRHRVVSKDDLIAHCWHGEPGNDGALARVVMNVRRSIGDIGDASEIIGTLRGVGYRFDAEVELSDVTGDAASASSKGVVAAAPAARLALLPFVNDTGDADLAWIELGLMSMLGKSLESIAGITMVPAHEILVALTGLPPAAPLDRRVQSVRRHLDPDLLVVARLAGSARHLALHVELQRGSGDVRVFSSVGADAAELAVEASKRLAEWLLPTASTSEPAALDLGDPFLNETFARALQTSREGRLVEAAHLLEVVADCGIEHAEMQHELAKVHVALGAPRAAAEVEALQRSAARSDNAALLASAGLLSSTLAWQRGDVLRAGSSAAEAAANAERAGRADLSVQCMIDAARHFGQCFDPRAAALLSRAIPQAERLGNRVLMRDAYYTAGRLCGFRNDWIGALHYHEAALAIANTMAEATRGQVLSSVGWAQLQLGHLEQGCDTGLEAFRCACISGAQPGIGEAAATAANGCLQARHMLDVARLFRQMQELEADRTLAMLIARELMCRVPFLRMTLHIDEALACIATTLQACRGNKVYEMYCHVGTLRVLLYARRFDEMLALCTQLRGSAELTDDPLLAPWIERAEAFADHLAFGRIEQALARLHRIVAGLPLCEPQARMALDLAWLHLERHEPALAEPLLVPLQSWLEQSDYGLLVRARLHHECGRFDRAVVEQRRFGTRFAAALTPFTASLLEAYEQAQRSGRRQPIERINLPLNLQFGLAPWVVQQLPVELGGPNGAKVPG